VFERDITIHHGAPLRLDFFVERGAPINIVSTTPGNPTEIRTATPHGLNTGNYVNIRKRDSTPIIVGNYKVSLIDDYRFSIPLITGKAGIGGIIYKPVNIFGYSFWGQVGHRYQGELSRPGATCTIAAGSSTVLVENLNPADIKPGDNFTCPRAGIYSVRVLSVFKATQPRTQIITISLASIHTVVDADCSFSSNPLATFSFEVAALSGRFTAKLMPHETDPLPINGDRILYYDIFASINGGTQQKLVHGKALLKPSVTGI